MNDEPPRVSLGAIFKVFFKIGATSFGGGLMAWIHRETVVARPWLTNDQFLPGMALAQVLPGANVSNLAVYVGQKLRGPLGATVAALAVLVPPFFLCIGFSVIYDDATRIPGFHAAMDGIAAAAIGMILRMGVTSAAHGCRHLPQALLAISVFAAVGVLNLSLVPVVLVAGPVSVWLAWRRKQAHA